MSDLGYHAETFGVRWRRRAVTIPLLYALAAAALLLLPVTLTLAGVMDLGLGPRRFARLRAGVYLTFFLCIEAIFLFGTLGVWLVNVPVAQNRARFLRHNAWLQTMFCTLLYRGLERLYGMRTECPDPVPEPSERPLLVFVRHASTADTLLPVVLLARGQGHVLRYVLKRELLFDPCLDVVGNRLPNCFVRRGGGERRTEVQQVLTLAEAIGPGEALVIYPEGTRFSAGKRARTLQRLADRGGSSAAALQLASELERTLSPLRAGPLALLQHNPGADLLVIGHTGLEPAGSLGSLFRGGLIGARVRLRLWRVPYDDLPRTESGQAALLADLWRQVDRFIQTTAAPA